MTLPPPRPSGYHSLTPYLTIKGAAQAISFYTAAFGARELCRMADAAGKVGHAELQIGDSRIMVSDEFPEWGALGPDTVGGTATQLMIYVEDATAAFERAVRAGGTVIMALEKQFYGDLCGKIQDPFGHKWMLAQRVEDISPDEMKKRAAESFGLNYTYSPEYYA
jgi:PhnB protein